ncbi:DUF5947 family protein [Streptomyces sp. CA-250714]|uniref:DUF5947 family protein n=1 Tax=Streptomyces sp. CA-250714 TaxID=3240060 RepID=UPI003D8EA8D6
MSPGALARVMRRAAEPPPAEDAERCDLCAAPVPADHRHLLETTGEQVLCACRPCSLLFVREAAGAGRYRLIPHRRRRLAPVPTAPLGVPVGLAFFVPYADGSVRAHYPGPAGAARWEVDPGAWHETVERCPELATLAAGVEALLVNTVQGREQHWIVPVDDCFRMVAVVRREWRGLSGGSRVWPALDRFFAELTEQ